MAEAENATFETYNTNQRRSEAFFRGGAAGIGSALPGSPAEGSTFIVTAGANANNLCEFLNGAWVYYPPIANDRIYVDSLGVHRYDEVRGWIGDSSSSLEVLEFTMQTQAESGVEDTTLEFGSQAIVIYEITANQTVDLTIYLDPESRALDTRTNPLSQGIPVGVYVAADVRPTPTTPARPANTTTAIAAGGSFFPARAINRSGNSTTIQIKYLRIGV
jgi:hypothetical protein